MADLAINKTHLILVNAVVKKNNKILVSQRGWEETHEPGKWTIPGGKVERTTKEMWNIIEKTLTREVLEETGVKIKKDVILLSNNSFMRSTGQHVVALIFLCYWMSGEAKPLDDTIDVRWIKEEEMGNFKFAPNVKKYIKSGFDFLK